MQKKSIFGSSPPSLLANLRFWSHLLLKTDFLSNCVGRIQNELINADGIIGLFFPNIYLSLFSLYYAEACNQLAGPISVSLHPGNTAFFEEMSQGWQAVGNTVSFFKHEYKIFKIVRNL